MESKIKVLGRKDRLLMTRAVSSPKTLGTLSEFEMRRVMAGAIELAQAAYHKWVALPENARIAKQAKETKPLAGDRCQTKHFFLRDEHGNLFGDDDDGKREGYLVIEEDRGGEVLTTMTFSPKEIDELEKACRASRPSKARPPVKKNAAN
jgi:hypothetical protein